MIFFRIVEGCGKEESKRQLILAADYKISVIVNDHCFNRYVNIPKIRSDVCQASFPRNQSSLI